MKSLLFQLCLFIIITIHAQKRPIVFLHGFLASGDTWSKPIHHFLLNDYTQKQLQVFDWNTIQSKDADSMLTIFIDKVLRLNKVKQVDLIGHSAGGNLGYKYCMNPRNSGKVANYIHIASGKLSKPAGVNGTIRTAIIYSTDDFVVKTAGDTEGATNIKLIGLDHYEAATSDTSFVKIFEFLNGKTPKLYFENYKIEKQVLIRNLYFATNEAIKGSKAIVQQYDISKGTFVGKEKTFITDSLGWWQMKVKGNDRFNYSIQIQPDSKKRKVYYFFDVIRNHKIISLRAFNTNNMIGMLLSQLPQNEKQPALCIFSSNKAILAGRDTLAVLHTAISGSSLTPSNKTIIAAFVYDDGDGKSSGEKHKAFSNAPFMVGVDCFLDSKKDKFIPIFYNGRTIKIPMIPSKQGITVVVLD